MKKVAVFTGAGISQESGIATFRDTDDGLWYNYDVDVVASLDGWKNDREAVLGFHNKLRSLLHDIEPNDAHKALVDLEEYADVTIVTQNIDNLHEKAGSSNILHVHGELLKSRSTADPSLSFDVDGDINLGDKCPKGSQLKPDTVLFGEEPRFYYNAVEAFADADYVLIIGTSLQITYTLNFFNRLGLKKRIYYIDPSPSRQYLDDFNINVVYVKSTAVEGVRKITDKIIGEIKEAKSVYGLKDKK